MGPLALLITAILATLVLYLWARKALLEKQLLEQQQENDRIMSVAEDLQRRLAASQGFRKAAPGLDMLERLCEQYYVYEGTDNLQPRVLKEVKTLVEGLRADVATQNALEQSLNESSDNVMKRLRETFPRWKDEDYLLYMFTASGFSSTTIAALLEKDKNYVYNHIYRLKERIKVSGIRDREFFLSHLQK
ncbi:MAG: hypothetical protein IJ623_09545 [Bacteroidales bacterium]|jgi:Rad3-related DNA helicase|nr:hypothetical protein [Bacteroidales bacterium]